MLHASLEAEEGKDNAGPHATGVALVEDENWRWHQDRNMFHEGEVASDEWPFALSAQGKRVASRA